MEAVKKHGIPPKVSKPLPDAQALPPYKAGQFVDQTSFDEAQIRRRTNYQGKPHGFKATG